MANWSTLKTAVANIINTNGNQAITGQLLQNVLNNIITNVGENATFAGIATLTTNPGAPDGPVFYFATAAGTYVNFNSLKVSEGEAAILQWNNGAWSKKNSGLATQEKLSKLEDKIGLANLSLEIKAKPREYLYGDFKKGDVISIEVSDFTTIGETGQANVAVLDNTNAYLKVFTGNGSAQITLPKDTTFLHIALGMEGYTGLTANVLVKYNIAKKTDDAIKSIGNLSEKVNSIITDNSVKDKEIKKLDFERKGSADLHLENSTTPREYLYGDFKKGDVISIEVSDFTTIGETGQANVAVLDETNAYLKVFTENGEAQIELPRDTAFLHVALGVEGYTGLTANVSIIKENSLPTIFEKKVYNKVDDIYINYEYQNSFLNRWAQAAEFDNIVYYGVNKPFEQDCKIKRLDFAMYADNYKYTGETAYIIIGTIDQRNWFLPIKAFEATVLSTGWQNKYYVVLDDVKCNAGQVVFIGIKRKDSTNSATMAGYYPGTNIEDSEKLCQIDNINNALTKYDFYPWYFKVYTTQIESIFSEKEKVEELRNELGIQRTELDLKQDSVLVDKATGEKYKLYVKNGSLSIKSIVYKNILYIGNSFSGFAWYDGRAMAASTPQTTYEEIIKSKLGGSYTVKSGVGFERDSANFNLSEWNLEDVFDCVVVQLGENGVYNQTLRTDCKRMYEYIINACPNADVYCIIPGYYNTDVRNAFINGAKDAGVTVYDIANVAMQCRYNTLGDYVYDANGEYTYLNNTGITQGHPSDIGMFNMANYLVQAWGYGIIDNRKFGIKAVQTKGGTISLICDYWISDGIVSVRTTNEIGYTANGLSVITETGRTITATKRDNEYGTFYTFIMPNENVTITPNWKVTN